MIFNKSGKNIEIAEDNDSVSAISNALEKIKNELTQINKVKLDIADINAKLNKFNDFFSYMFSIKQMQEATGVLKLFQVSCLKLAYHFSDFLKSHNITEYWLDFHSLLGAYRNETFAPWDDSISFSLTKSSFLKLLEILESQKYTIEFNLYNAEFMIITSSNRSNIIYNLVVRDSKKITAIINLFVYEEKTFTTEEEVNDYKNSFRHNTSSHRSSDKLIISSKDMQFSSIIRRIKENRRIYSGINKKRVDTNTKEVGEAIGNENISNEQPESSLNLTNPDTMKAGEESYYVLSNEHNYKQILLIKKSTIFPLQKIDFASYSFNAPFDIRVYLSNIYKSLSLNPYNLQEGRLFNAENIASIVSSEDTLLQFITKK